MSTVEIVGITTLGSLLTVIISRIRCILRPCDPDGNYCMSGCTDQKLDRSAHELKIDEHNLNGRDVLVVASND